MANTKHYKIIPIQHLLKGNKVAKAGDIVKGSQFINLQDSLDRGFCEEVKGGKKANKDAEKAAAEKAAAEKAAAENQGDGDETSKSDETGEGEEIDLSKLSIKELLAFAVDNEIELSEEVKKSKTKAPIIDAIVESI